MTYSDTSFFLAHWVHNIDPFAIRFQLGPLEGIRWYGLAYLFGFLIGGLLLYLYHKKGKLSLNFEDQTNLLTALIIGVLLGGRLGYMLLYDLQDFAENPLIFFKIWKGGMSSHGGFIGVLIAIYWFSKKYSHPFWNILDTITTIVTPGIFLGRIANFINQELYGTITTVSWGVIFPASAPYEDFPLDLLLPRHPYQLYAALLEGLLIFIYTQYRFWFSNITTKHPGCLTGEFLLLYGSVRIITEYFREPDASLIFNLHRGVFYSIFILITGLILVLYRIRRSRP